LPLAFVRVDHEDFVFHLHCFVLHGVGFGRPCCRGRSGLRPEHRDVNFQKVRGVARSHVELRG
jgi:hypothetical protein